LRLGENDSNEVGSNKFEGWGLHDVLIDMNEMEK
jgi:hypothetical protein